MSHCPSNSRVPSTMSTPFSDILSRKHLEFAITYLLNQLGCFYCYSAIPSIIVVNLNQTVLNIQGGYLVHVTRKSSGRKAPSRFSSEFQLHFSAILFALLDSMNWFCKMVTSNCFGAYVQGKESATSENHQTEVQKFTLMDPHLT